MIYQIKTTNKKSFWSSKFFIFSVGFFIFIFIFSVSNTVRSLTVRALLPFFGIGSNFYDSIGSVPKFWTLKNEIIEENKQLSSELDQLRISLLDYQTIKYENQKLREEIGFRPLGNFITARIIARSPQIPNDTLLINKGLGDGVKTGDFVLVGERILLGKIGKISENAATVVLNSFPDVSYYGTVERTSGYLEIKGRGGANMEVRVPIDFDILEGDKIIVSLKAPYLAAIVGNVESDQPSGFKTVLLSLPVEISKIDLVFIESNIN